MLFLYGSLQCSLSGDTFGMVCCLQCESVRARRFSGLSLPAINLTSMVLQPIQSSLLQRLSAKYSEGGTRDGFMNFDLVLKNRCLFSEGNVATLKKTLQEGNSVSADRVTPVPSPFATHNGGPAGSWFAFWYYCKLTLAAQLRLSVARLCP